MQMEIEENVVIEKLPRSKLRVIDRSGEPVIEFENVVKITISTRAAESALRRCSRVIGECASTALGGVSFKIYAGESVGFIGRNGAGKSTILKMITGVSYPTSGDVTVRGKVAALLEPDGGLFARDDGQENITMKGYLLGLTDDDIAEIEDDIINFADLGEYIDQPVLTYSSGMKMRLGFAININIHPDILVVDEALSVGDSRFRKNAARLSRR